MVYLPWFLLAFSYSPIAHFDTQSYYCYSPPCITTHTLLPNLLLNNKHIVAILEGINAHSSTTRRPHYRLANTTAIMPSARGGYSTVEVKPDSATSKSNIAPSSPGSPKAVRFAPAFKAESRALDLAESWSCYHLETHCRQCNECYKPVESRQLCATGLALARDVAEHVYRQDGAVYSRKKDNTKLVQVDLPKDYTQVPQVLKLLERAQRTKHRAPPVVSYEPVFSRRTTPDEDERTTKVTIEPTRAKSHRSSKHKSTRYKTVVVQEDVDESATTPVKKERRGSLYYEDMARQRKEAYEVEIRQPDRKERRRDRERPLSGFWL